MDTALRTPTVTRADAAESDRHARALYVKQHISLVDAPVADAAASLRMHAIAVPRDLWRGHTLLRAIYRVFECSAACAMLVLAAPILALEAILIRLDSPGPALFWQRRIGQSVVRRGRELMHRDDLIPPNGGFEPETAYLVPEAVDFVKFRTMYVDARERFPELYDVRFDSHEAFLASYYKRANDPRVTRVGRFLRRTTLDELPNLFLVITGKMRLVGPRPEGPWLVPYYTPRQMLKFAVKPGVTGLAQASGRGQLPIGDQIELDLEYVHRRSVWLDLTILFQTFLGVLRQKGAF
jgi:lipopolysaccharide/colanic/teichoic acid biosynthesis glycosyltransferase